VHGDEPLGEQVLRAREVDDVAPGRELEQEGGDRVDEGAARAAACTGSAG
jgi:hypothetical protein